MTVLLFLLLTIITGTKAWTVKLQANTNELVYQAAQTHILYLLIMTKYQDNKILEFPLTQTEARTSFTGCRYN